MNSLDGRIKANAAIVPGGYQGAVSVYASNTTDVVLDIDGYFTTPSAAAMAFYPLTPCRVFDTRNATAIWAVHADRRTEPRLSPSWKPPHAISRPPPWPTH